MKEHDSEWISVSDFMTSVVAILIIFIISFILDKKKEEHSIDKQKTQIVAGLIKIEGQIRQLAGKNIVRLDTANLSIIFEDGAFDTGKPCITDSMRVNLSKCNTAFLERLAYDNDVSLLIEGYTDTTRFVQNKKGISECYCDGIPYYFKDNVSLSMYRAWEVRRYLVQNWDYPYQERVIISGYGRTKQDSTLNEDGNRRVIIKMDIQKKRE